MIDDVYHYSSLENSFIPGKASSQISLEISVVHYGIVDLGFPFVNVEGEVIDKGVTVFIGVVNRQLEEVLQRTLKVFSVFQQSLGKLSFQNRLEMRKLLIVVVYVVSLHSTKPELIVRYFDALSSLLFCCRFDIRCVPRS